MIWSFRHESSDILAFFTAYMYWDGDIPILAYTEADFDRTKPFLAYKSDSPKGEEWQFCDEADDTRFKYASVIDVKSLPDPFVKSIEGDFPDAPDPVLTELQDTKSLAGFYSRFHCETGTSFLCGTSGEEKNTYWATVYLSNIIMTPTPFQSSSTPLP